MYQTNKFFGKFHFIEPFYFETIKMSRIDKEDIHSDETKNSIEQLQTGLDETKNSIEEAQ
jgi:hypothetical protein